MENKQEEDISWLFLWGATILYTVVLCMAFSGLIALDEHGKSVIVIFTDFVKDYGSLLAGIPVLIAVLVAKQQLDANRRQHVATVKRSLKDELDALDSVWNIARKYKNLPISHFINDSEEWVINSIPSTTIKLIELHCTSRFTEKITKVDALMHDLLKLPTEKALNNHDACKKLRQLTALCSELYVLTNERQNYLSQYWS